MLSPVDLAGGVDGARSRDPWRDSVSRPDFCRRPWTEIIHVVQWVTSFHSSADVRLNTLESSDLEGTVRARKMATLIGDPDGERPRGFEAQESGQLPGSPSIAACACASQATAPRPGSFDTGSANASCRRACLATTEAPATRSHVACASSRRERENTGACTGRHRLRGTARRNRAQGRDRKQPRASRSYPLSQPVRNLTRTRRESQGRQRRAAPQVRAKPDASLGHQACARTHRCGSTRCSAARRQDA